MCTVCVASTILPKYLHGLISNSLEFCNLKYTAETKLHTLWLGEAPLSMHDELVWFNIVNISRMTNVPYTWNGLVFCRRFVGICTTFTLVTGTQTWTVLAIHVDAKADKRLCPIQPSSSWAKSLINNQLVGCFTVVVGIKGAIMPNWKMFLIKITLLWLLHAESVEHFYKL